MTQANELRRIAADLERSELQGEFLLALEPPFDSLDTTGLSGTPLAVVELATRLLRAVAERREGVFVDDLFSSEAPCLDYVELVETFDPLPGSPFEEGWQDRVLRIAVISVLMFCFGMFALGLTTFLGFLGSYLF